MANHLLGAKALSARTPFHAGGVTESLETLGRGKRSRDLRVDTQFVPSIEPERGGWGLSSITTSDDVTNRRIRGGLGHQGIPRISRGFRRMGPILCSQRLKRIMIHLSRDSLRDTAERPGGVRKTSPQTSIPL